MKNILYIIIIIFLSNCRHNSSVKKTPNSKIDTLFYRYKGFNNGMKLYLFSNNKFKYEFYSYGCMGGGETEKIKGDYILENNKLHLKPDSVNIKVLDFDSHSKFTEYNLKYKNDSLKIKTEYDIIKWNNIEYLISPQKNANFRTHEPIFMVDYDIDSIVYKRNGYHDFADYYNLGLEPQKHGRYLTQIKKEKDSVFEKLKINTLQKEWRYLFLENPISSKIVNIRKEERFNEYEKEKYYVTILTLDKGSKNKVRIGMKFYDKTENKYVKIINVSKSQSYGITSETFSKNELVKTNWKK